MKFNLLPRPLRSILLLALFTTSTLTSAQHRRVPVESKASSSVESFRPCQTRSPNSGSFFDLNPIHVLPAVPEPSSTPSTSRRPKTVYPSTGKRWIEPRAHDHGKPARRKGKKAGSGNSVSVLEEKDEKEKEPPKSWKARGYDYPANFTMNFCGPVVEAEPEGDPRPIVGHAGLKWDNVSAFYVMDDKTFSLGQVNTNLTWRGRKLTLNYTGGSPCPRAGVDQRNQSAPENWSRRRKSTLISLLCERDPLAPKVSIAFVGTNDECTYFFEARSQAACPAIQIEKQQVGPSGVFAVIFVIAILVYLFGGIVYQRAVMHQRGWRQLPNYSLWSGIFNFTSDVLSFCLSSCGRCLGVGSGARKPRGYNQVHPISDVGVNGGMNGGLRMQEDENRLLDELDEEFT